MEDHKATGALDERLLGFKTGNVEELEATGRAGWKKALVKLDRRYKSVGIAGWKNKGLDR